MAVYTERSLEILGVFTKDMKIYKWYIEKYFYWLLTSTNTSLSILIEKNRCLSSHSYMVKYGNVSKSVYIRLFVRVFRILYKLTGKNSPEHHQGWRDYSIICIQYRAWTTSSSMSWWPEAVGADAELQLHLTTLIGSNYKLCMSLTIQKSYGIFYQIYYP